MIVTWPMFATRAHRHQYSQCGTGAYWKGVTVSKAIKALIVANHFLDDARQRSEVTRAPLPAATVAPSAVPRTTSA